MTKANPERPRVSEAVSIVAHQLKNPLSVIKGYLEVLISKDLGKINQKQKEYLEDALENVGRMTKIVNYFLDVSRIEEGKYEVRPKLTALEEVAQEVIKGFSSWVKASNCEIIFKKPKKLPKVLVDPLKIHQVIENLIVNAIKFKSAGQGKVEINLGKKDKHLLFTCKDNGIGIPRKDFKKVFSKFYRSEKSIEFDPSGSGLGLYINKAIIELSGGKIWFKKNKDFGMTFYFTLPIAKI